MTWRPLDRARRLDVPKLANLARAARLGLEVPPTRWLPAHETPDGLPADLPGPWILRSGSPTEDGLDGSRAGAFESVVLEDPGHLADAWRRVAGSLPQGPSGAPAGVVFLQSFLRAEAGGVAFFDGFHLERTEAAGGNQALTSGAERGRVTREHLRRGDPFHAWLARVHRHLAHGPAGAIDVEYLRDGTRFVLLQVRPALFDVHRNPTVSLANHKEILGDPPSPWIVSVLDEAGARALDFFAAVDPALARFEERYCHVALGRAWIDLAAFFRLMDHWGLPRTFVTAGIGGEGAEGAGGAASDPLDERVVWGRFLRSAPRLVLLQLRNGWTVLRSGRTIERAAARLDAARGLSGLFDAGVHLLDVILRVNFAINGALAGMLRVRRALRIRGRARIVTRVMMEEYEALRTLPREERAAGLARWLERHGHRGPLESDPLHPRFRELGDLLAADLDAADPSPAAPAAAPPRGSLLTRPFFWLDERRESFRDDLMRVWARWRERLLEEARPLVAGGWLEREEDVFFLTREDLGARDLLRARALERREQHALLARIDPPGTATLERLRELEQEALADEWDREPGPDPSPAARPSSYRGIALTPRDFEGRVLRARDLRLLLEGLHTGRLVLDASTVLVVPALEPSWAVVFGRVGAVVAELGGELSHASILLREAGKPALVGASGCFAHLVDGQRVRLDARAGRLLVLGDATLAP